MTFKEWAKKMLKEWGEDEIQEVLMITKSPSKTVETYNFSKEQ